MLIRHSLSAIAWLALSAPVAAEVTYLVQRPTDAKASCQELMSEGMGIEADIKKMRDDSMKRLEASGEAMVARQKALSASTAIIASTALVGANPAAINGATTALNAASKASRDTTMIATHQDGQNTEAAIRPREQRLLHLQTTYASRCL
ncbi:hypothetical protein [Caulobacter sp. NIBR2454]|uniref:hypothetical protein n=1 Tax=Caulobacter sp. NIBR2454 TaxID=3015996 RepID=UPI0022B6D778|nr:hypothetical protein [Caulobacter sp. NIBR2454]